MMHITIKRLAFTLIFAGLLAATVDAKKVALEIGAPTPDWKKLRGTDGKEHSLSDLKEAAAIVVVFTCNDCPFAQGYEERLAKLMTAYKERGLAVIAINPNKTEDLEAMRTRAKESKFPYPYVQDATQEVAKKFGALRTPEVFLLDKQRKIAYTGAIDDATLPGGEPKVKFLQDAVDAVLAGKAPPRTVTRAVGCTIQWR